LATLRREFGRRIRQIRADLNKTQEEFAEVLGVSVDFLSLIERGKNSPSFGKLEIMAKRLGKPVSYLFSFDKPSSLLQKHKGLKTTDRSASSR